MSRHFSINIVQRKMFVNATTLESHSPSPFSLCWAYVLSAKDTREACSSCMGVDKQSNVGQNGFISLSITTNHSFPETQQTHSNHKQNPQFVFPSFIHLPSNPPIKTRTPFSIFFLFFFFDNFCLFKTSNPNQHLQLKHDKHHLSNIFCRLLKWSSDHDT